MMAADSAPRYGLEELLASYRGAELLVEAPILGQTQL